MICFDSDAPKSNRLMFIGTDNFQAGKLLGAEIVKVLPDGGDVAVFVGTMSADNAQKRKAGVEAALAEAQAKTGKHYAVVVTKEDNVDHGKARANVEDVMSSYKNVKLLCGLWAYNGPAIANAIIDAKNKGGTPPLAAVFDEDQGTLDAIRSGVITCTVVQHPFEFGYRACTYMRDLAYKGESALPKDPFVNTGVEVINAANVDEFSKRLAEMKAYLPH
jgi:ribose transport system substrate-binding protein